VLVEPMISCCHLYCLIVCSTLATLSAEGIPQSAAIGRKLAKPGKQCEMRCSRVQSIEADEDRNRYLTDLISVPERAGLRDAKPS
jgi:hypothetical protein